ncbi:MAG TPA: class I SAM-dependent methyltransferase [Terriglobales bacterium]|nr:class I SAM-dependent methyltransferase [Terriglobales bacterium]
MPQALRRLAQRNRFFSLLYNLPRFAKGYEALFVDYPVRPVPRYGYGKPEHRELTRILAKNDTKYAETLKSFLAFREGMLTVPARAPRESTQPCWINKWFEGLDTFALYGFVASRNAKLHIEVGSGYSTRLVRHVIRQRNLQTELVSIDPAPRADIDKLCDRIVRARLEDCDLKVFDRLQAGDTLFFDGSHRTFMNSDVTVFFLEVLPRLKPGITVHIHDIYLPVDYPPERAHWYYSEQYMLAASLLAGHAGFEVTLPNHYIAHRLQLAGVLQDLWADQRLAEVPRTGTSFWIETR